LDLNSVAAEATIAALVVVVISGLLYWLGVIRPIKANAEWWATTHENLASVVVVDAILTSRTRNTKTVFDAALAKDPGWPRRLRARLHSPDLTTFYVPSPVPKDYSPSIPASGLAVAGRGEMKFKDQLEGTALPYDGKARLWIQVGKRNFYFKLKERKT
jgi:hypothetical protein